MVAGWRTGGSAHYCVNEQRPFDIYVYPQSVVPPGQTIYWTVWVDQGVGVVGVSNSDTGPYSESIIVPTLIYADGSGFSDSFYIKGLQVGWAHVSGCSNELGCTVGPAPHGFDVNTINSLELVAIDSPLDNNPNTGGGLRIFPEKQFPTDSVNRRRLKISVNTSLTNAPVFLRSFDIDDPSPWNTSPVDSNGSAGNDNRGSPQAGSFPSTQLNTISATTDGNGVAEVEFEVTVKPGDNFKIAASCNDKTLPNVIVDGTDLKDNSGNTLPTEQANVTEMLTVWRKFHVEVDSMGLVANNDVSGTIKSARYSKNNNTTVLSVSTSSNLDQNRFENGRISITDIGGVTVLSNGTGSVTVQGLVDEKLSPGKAFGLFDDDDFNNNDGSNKRGDEEENIPAPDLSLMADSLDNGICDNSATNVFGPAYVCPVFDLSGNEDFVPFVLNLADEMQRTIQDLWLLPNSFNNLPTEADPDFWTGYLLAGYQPTLGNDGDPNSEAQNPGLVLGICDCAQGGVVFVETIRELSPQGSNCTVAATAAHELGHLLGAEDNDGGIYAKGCSNTPVFTDISIAKIRDRTNP